MHSQAAHPLYVNTATIRTNTNHAYHWKSSPVCKPCNAAAADDGMLLRSTDQRVPPY